jgi:hypothetical protein
VHRSKIVKEKVKSKVHTLEDLEKEASSVSHFFLNSVMTFASLQIFLTRKLCSNLMLNLAFVSTLKSKVWSTKPATSFGRKPTGEPYKKCISMLVKYKRKKKTLMKFK